MFDESKFRIIEEQPLAKQIWLASKPEWILYLWEWKFRNRTKWFEVYGDRLK